MMEMEAELIVGLAFASALLILFAGMTRGEQGPNS
jgi:hypothetical protein